MTSISVKRAWLAILVTTLFMAIGFEITKTLQNSSLASRLVVPVVSLVFGGAFTNIIVKALLSFKTGRWILMGDGFLEGYWLWETWENTKTESVLLTPSISYISYVGDHLELRVVGHRPFGARDGKLSPLIHNTHSEYAAIRDYDGSYFNFASMPRGDSTPKLYAVGRFFKDGTVMYPNVYSGSVILDSDLVYRNQSARKIPDSVVRKFKAEYGDSWMVKYIELHSGNPKMKTEVKNQDEGQQPETGSRVR